jgi:hypothetical protein
VPVVCKGAVDDLSLAPPFQQDSILVPVEESALTDDNIGVVDAEVGAISPVASMFDDYVFKGGNGR